MAIMEGSRLMIFDPDDEVLLLRDVKTGIANWDFTEVISGLEEGELVVTSLDRPGVEDGAYAKREAFEQ
jgi:HlyD family secretion protein